MDAPIVLRNFSGVPEITPDAHELKRNALAVAAPITKVENAKEQLTAVDALKQLKAVRNGMELSRKAVKAPVIDLGRKIDDIAYNFLADVTRAENRLQGLVNHYQRKQIEVKRTEEKKLARSDEEVTELEIQIGKLRQEALFETDGGKKRFMLNEADQLSARLTDLDLTAQLSERTDMSKPKGLVVRQRISFQVTDPIVFVQAWPQFWIAATVNNHENELLRVDRQRVLDELNKERCDGVFHRTKFPEELSASDDQRLVRPAGLRVFEEIKPHVR